jgi:hypothetical protein
MVVVDYLGEKIKLESIPQTFADFNAWVISRFGISIKEQISYRNLSDHEIIPNGTTFCEEDYIKVISFTKNKGLKRQASILDLAPMSLPASLNPTPEITSNFFHFYFGPIVIIIMAMCLSPNSGSYIEYAVSTFGVIDNKSWKNTCCDCLVNFLSWSFSYLFVRRLLNPETSPVVFEKFSTDAFYGGLAAATTAFMKPILFKALQS